MLFGLQVEASDTSLTVAAPLSVSSTSTSARNSFQLPILQLSTPGNSNASLPAARAAEQPQQQADGAAAGTGCAKSIAAQGAAVAIAGASMPVAVHAGGLAAAMLQLLQMAQELQAYLSIECCSSQGSSSAGSSTPADADGTKAVSRTNSPQQPQMQQQPSALSSFAQASAQIQQQPQQQGTAAEGGSRARPRTPLQLLQPQAPQWWHGQIQLHMALHVGPLTAGVVGRRRPRYRLMGPALQVGRQACGEAPANRTVATADAAQLLQASGVQSLKPLGSRGCGGDGRGGAPQLQLWVLSAGAVVPALQQATVSGGTAGVLNRAAAVLAAGQPVGPLLMKIGSVEVPVSAAAGIPSAAAAGPASAAAGVITQQREQQSPLLPPQSLPPPPTQQQQFSTSSGCMPPQSLGAPLPPLPPLLDPAVQQSQQLLMQELSALAQQLAAVSAGASMVAPGSGMQPPWNHIGCSPANGISTPAAVNVLNLDSTAGQVAGVSQPVGLTTAATGAVTRGVAASAAALVDMSLSLSLHDWQASPMKGALTVPGGSASLQANGAGTDGTGGVACSVPSSVPASSTLGCAVPGFVGLQDAAAAAVGVPVEVQLGAAELQQISMINQELAALQQQITSAMGGGIPPGPTNGLAHQRTALNHMNGHSAVAQPHGVMQQPQQQQYGSAAAMPYLPPGSTEAQASSVAGSSSTPVRVGSASDAPAAAAAAAGHGLLFSSVSSSGAGSYAAVELDQAPAADSSAETSYKAQQADGVGRKGRTKSGQLFGQLFRRRSSRKQQQPSQE